MILAEFGPMQTIELKNAPLVMAPDGSDVRILAACSRGSMAQFSLAAGQVSQAVTHRTVDEVWFFTAGQGRMWRKTDTAEEIVELRPGLSLSILAGTHFQFRNDGSVALTAIGTTMPPWPGDDEAYQVTGIW
jgi:mannose-6-phosphate isomerase-like protein (cupin superfamily)